MQSHETVAILSVAIVVAMAFIGVGYGLEYSGSSLNSGNAQEVIYMTYKLNDQNTCTFEFDDITYYRDRDDRGHITYKSTTSESAKMKLWIEGTGAKNVDTVAKVKLAEVPTVSEESEVPLASITLQIYTEYTDAEHNTPLWEGDPIELTDEYIEIPEGLKTDENYWCIITVELNTLVLEGAENVVVQPSGTLKFDVVFYATAEATA